MSEKVTEKTRLIDTLCGDSEWGLLNVKFCRGNNEIIDEEAFCEEVSRGLFEVDNNRSEPSETFPETIPQIVVKEFVAKYA